MTSRKLFARFLVICIGTALTSCTIFQSTDSGADAESASVTDELSNQGDPADELLEETDDLIEESSASDADEAGEDADSAAADSEKEELAEDNEGESADADDDEFAEDEEGEEQAATDENEEISELKEDDQVEDELAEDELADGSDTAEKAGVAEEFLIDEEPIGDEAANAQQDSEAPVVAEPEVAIIETDEDTPVSKSTNAIVNLAYKSFDNGGTVVIETTEPAPFKLRNEPDLNQIVVEVDGVSLPEQFKRPYIAKDFKQDVATINAYQTAGGATARVVIQMKRPVKPYVEQQGNSILVMTSAPAMGDGQDDMVIANEMSVSESAGDAEIATGEQITAREAPAPQEDFQPNAADNEGGVAAKSTEGMGLPANSNTLDNINYQGSKMDLEVSDVDVREVIQMISEQSGVNLIMDRDVNGPVNLRLRRVPWDQALMVVLRSQGLGYKREGNVLRIARQSTLSLEAQAISKQIESEQRAKLLASGLKVKYLPVSYADVTDLAKKLTAFSSKEGNITFDNRTSSLVVSDYDDYIERITKLAKSMDTPPMQVEIEAKIVEARESFIRSSGIEWQQAGQNLSLGGDRNLNITTQNNTLNFQSTEGFLLDLNVGTFDVFGDLTAALAIFERQNIVNVLSSPRIQTMNREEATIKQTTQIPIQQIQQNQAGNLAGIQYRDLALELKVNPQITFKGDVILQVEVTRQFASPPDSSGNRELNSREAKTKVMVKNGQTAVIGGIYQNDSSKGENGIPWLKDIPFIGSLFRSDTRERQKNELLVFLKPTVMSTRDNSLIRNSSTPPSFDGVSSDEAVAESDQVDDSPPATGSSEGSEAESDFTDDDAADEMESDLEDLTI